MGTKASKENETVEAPAPEPRPVERLATLEADNADLKAQIAQLTELITRPRPSGPMLSPAELARTLTNDPMVRPEGQGAINPVSKKPYFNDLRPTGKH
jgi:hypothetical protein